MFYGSDNFSVGVGLSIASPTHYSTRYMADQTFHTPNFGDEEFDIPPITLAHDPNMNHMNYSQQMGMHVNQGQHQQQQHYSMYLPEHMSTPMTMNSPVQYGASPPTYTNLSSPHPPPQSGGHHMMHHHPHQGRPPHPSQQQSVMGNAPNVPQIRRSPLNSSISPTNPESHSHSDDSDDSVPQVGGAPCVVGKRPSPEPERTVVPSAAPPKKPKPQKKKKKRDPNEPQKPVSAYALFFRDTQGQNPNASFGEVSKIVASMWDALDVEHKNVYKKKTEAAKKEYLKALAAYRASLVSKGAPTEAPDGSGMYPPPNFNPNMQSQQHYQQVSQNYYAGQQVASQLKKPSTQQQQHHAPPNQQHSGHSQMMQMGGNSSMESQQQQYGGHGGMGHNPNYMNTMGDGHMHSNQGNGQMNSGSVMNHMVAEGQSQQRQMCVRNGCNNVASTPVEADMQGYDEGYCSSGCVVTHCRDVFSNWVSTNQSGNSNYNGGMNKYSTSASNAVGPDGLSYVT